MTATTETATSTTMSNPSPGKQPLTKSQLGAMLRSADVEDTWKSSAKENLSLLCASVDSIASAGSVDFWMSKDLGAVFASSDSVKLPPLPPLASSSAPPSMPFASIDAAVGLMSATDPSAIPQSLVATLMSKDSVFASKDSVFASIDPLPFRSLDSVMSFNAISNDATMTDASAPPTTVAVPGIYESRDWLGFYEKSHCEVPYTKDVFRTSDSPPPPPTTEIKRKSSKCWEKYYEAMKRNSIVTPEIKPTPAPVVELPNTTTAPKSSTKKSSSPKKTKRGEPKEKIYVEPTPKDIISGRGGKSNSWPGNERYRAAIEEAKPAYRDGQKYEKTIMSQEIVEKMMAEGRRFLKLEDSGPHQGEYYLMTKNQARKKAGQALREENTPESRKAKRDFYANRAKQQEQQN